MIRENPPKWVFSGQPAYVMIFVPGEKPLVKLEIIKYVSEGVWQKRQQKQPDLPVKKRFW